MDIKIKNNRVQIADMSAFTNRIIYSVSELKDSVSFIFNGSVSKSAVVKETTVNGIQMTTDNIDELLSPLFVTSSGSDTTGTVTQDAAYTKAEYSDPLVFPIPIRSGHIVEFYKDSELYRSYQWNGWDWIIIGAKPNLIFTRSGTAASVLDDNILYVKRDNNQYRLTLGNNIDYTNMQIYASNIELINIDCILGFVSLVQNSGQSNIVSSLRANSFMSNTSDIEQFAESLILRNCQFNLFDLNTQANKVIVDNVKYIKDEGQFGGNIYALETTIMDTDMDSISVYIIQEDKAMPSESMINISNNTTENELSINIVGNYDGNTKTDASITLDNNKNMCTLNITSFNEGSRIKYFSGLFCNSLISINVDDSNFTQSAFDSFIDSLTSIPQGEIVSRNIQLLKVTPSLSDIQKAALIDAGWSIK